MARTQPSFARGNIPNEDIEQISDEISSPNSVGLGSPRMNQQFASRNGLGLQREKVERPSNSTLTIVRGTILQQAIGHPLYYARSLIQMGYEPMEPTLGRTLFAKQAFFYPNMFQYLKYIYKIDGFLGLYNGFGCALTAKIVSWHASTHVDKVIESPETPEDKDPKIISLNKTIKKTLREIRNQSYGVFLSQPFYVMTIRCMGQFIGRETKYSSINIFKNIQEIYRDHGIGGFFMGFIPRWLAEIITIAVTNFVIYFFRTQLSAEGGMDGIFDYMASLSAQTLTYPFSVVSTVMAVNQSGLRAGTPPFIGAFQTWQEAYDRLAGNDQLKRGSSLFNRMAPPPLKIQPGFKFN